MAAWDELLLACNLKEDIPQQAIDVLEYMISPQYNVKTQTFESIPVPDEHPFFKETEWHIFLKGETYYFPGEPFASLSLDDEGFYKLTIRAMVPMGNENIELFLHWLAPYSETDGFVGYMRRDEDPDQIELIYFENGEIYYNSVQMWKDPPEINRRKIDPTTS